MNFLSGLNLQYHSNVTNTEMNAVVKVVGKNFFFFFV